MRYQLTLLKTYNEETPSYMIRAGWIEHFTEAQLKEARRRGFVRIVQGHGTNADIPLIYWKMEEVLEINSSIFFINVYPDKRFAGWDANDGGSPFPTIAFRHAMLWMDRKSAENYARHYPELKTMRIRVIFGEE
jgi:hypothetical protein